MQACPAGQMASAMVSGAPAHSVQGCTLATCWAQPKPKLASVRGHCRVLCSPPSPLGQHTGVTGWPHRSRPRYPTDFLRHHLSPEREVAQILWLPWVAGD